MPGLQRRETSFGSAAVKPAFFLTIVALVFLLVRPAPGLRVGYVMGVGDQVPAGIAQLGAEVQLLDSAALATGDLSVFDAIVTGTRAYAVRDPFPGQLTRRAEEVSEEDSPMTILEPEHPVLSWPNRITSADFDGWVEQRGSKWWSEWDPAYTALLQTHDIGQEPQSGGWLHARYGKGHYSYFAYAMHRQLPYGVPGAYRLFANVLSMGRSSAGEGGGLKAVALSTRGGTR